MLVPYSPHPWWPVVSIIRLTGSILVEELQVIIGVKPLGKLSPQERERVPRLRDMVERERGRRSRNREERERVPKFRAMVGWERGRRCRDIVLLSGRGA